MGEFTSSLGMPAETNESAELAKLNADRTRGEQEQRRNELSKYLLMASAGKPRLELLRKDPEKLGLILALIERQDDGSERYLTEGIQRIVMRQQVDALGLAKELERIKLRLNGDVSAYVRSLSESVRTSDAHIALEETSGGSVLRSAEVKPALDALKTKLSSEDLIAKRSNIVKASQLVITAVSEGKKVDQVLAAINPLLAPHLSADEMKAIAAVLAGSSIIDYTTRDAALKTLADAGRITVIPNDKAASALKMIHSELLEIRKLKNAKESERAGARREFNHRFGGNDAATVINFAIATVDKKQRIDFNLLQNQLRALGVDVTAGKLASAAALDRPVYDGICDIDDAWDRKPLIKFIEDQNGFKNPAGVSLESMYKRGTEAIMVREMTERLVKESTVDQRFDVAGFHRKIAATGLTITLTEIAGAIGLPSDGKLPENWNADALSDLLRKKIDVFINDDSIKGTIGEPGVGTALNAGDLIASFGLKGVSSSQLFQAASLPPDGTIPKDWDSAGLVSFIRTKRYETLTGVRTDSIDIPLKERIKEYASSFRTTAAVATDRWWKWYATLPSNFYEKDDTLLKLLDREKALLGAKGLIKDATEGWQKRSDDSFEIAFDDMKSAQDRLNAARKPAGPARDVKEKVEQSVKLMEAASFVFDALNEGTDYQLQRDPQIRRTAFWIAMNYGLASAREYLANPSNYWMTHNADDEVGGAASYGYKVRHEKEIAGDRLAPMYNKFGVRVAPLALKLLSETTLGRGGPLLSTGETRIDNWLTEPQKAGPALLVILYDDPAFDHDPSMFRADPKTGAKVRIGRELIIRAFTTQKDIPGLITAAEATQFVSRVRDHLVAQSEDMQRNLHQNEADDGPGDPLNYVRGGMEAVSNMIGSDDLLTRGLGISLALGAGYAIYRGWKRGGITRLGIIGVPMFFGLDVALKKSTGKGLMARLGLNYLDEKDRNSSFEQFVRRNPGLDDEAGREALKQLMDPDRKIPLASLLQWRRQVRERGGDTGFAQGAPDGISSGAIMEKIGLTAAYNYHTKELRDMAYQKAFLAFDSFCADVARANGLGGETPHEQAQRGAELLERRYVKFDEEYMRDCHFLPAFKKACGPYITLREVMTYERQTPGMNDALNQTTALEWTAAKLGVALGFLKRKLAEGYTETEIQYLYAKEQAPEYLGAGKRILSNSYESFMNWARPTYEKLGREIPEDFTATWNFLSGTVSKFGLVVYEKGPGVVEWVYDKTLDTLDFTKDKALDIWRELHRHQIVGNMLEGFDSLFALLFHESVKDADIEDVSKVDVIRKSVVNILENSTMDPPSGFTFSTLADTWLVQAGVANADGAGALSPVPGDSSAKRMLRAELLKREMFSYLAAARIDEISRHLIDPTYKREGKMDVPWPKAFDRAAMQFTRPSGDLKDTYEHIRSHYSSQRILPLIGRERAFPEGFLEDYVARNPDTYLGTAGGFADYVLGFAFRSDASEYIPYDRSVYLAPLDAEAKKIFGEGSPAYNHYKEYLDTLLLNVVMESALRDPLPEGRDLTLGIAEARRYLYNLQTTRGDVAKANGLKDLENDLSLFGVDDKAPSEVLNTVASHPRGKELLAGVAPKASASAGAVPGGAAGSGSSSPSVPPAAPSARPEQIEDARNADMKTLEGQKKVLKVIRTGAATAEMRKRFDNSINHVSAFDYNNPEQRQELNQYLLGVTNPKSVENIIAPKIVNIKQLDPLVAFRDACALPDEKARVQHAIDRCVVDLLLMSDSAVTRLLNANSADLAQGTTLFRSLAAELGNAYRISSDATAAQLPDTISLAIEYLVIQGDYDKYKGKIVDYNEMLKGLGIPETSTAPRNAKNTAPGTVASERFTNGGKQYVAPLKKIIPRRLSTARGEILK